MFIPCTVWTVARTNRGTAVLLKNEESGKSVPFFINSAEAQTILNCLKEKESPSLHGLTKLLCQKGDFIIKFIEIRPKRSDKARAFVRIGQTGQDDFTNELTPADALTFALKCQKEVHIPQLYFERKAVIIQLTELEKKAKKKKLENKLNHHVEREEYEEAAVIRDRLIELDLEI
ncbi:MAG: DUF151 domain-containing protein [Spirochaetales bacterium]|nr:DUF151 domain-containing protein [Spirochaetales bacterium]